MHSPPPNRNTIAVIAISAFLAGCATTAAPRFPPDVATAFARDNMRRLDTPLLSIYYPEQRKAEALRFADRVERCAAVLKSLALLHNNYADQKLAILMPEA